MFIDAQVHVYDATWPSARPTETVLEVDGEQMVEAMHEVGVDGAILVSSWAGYGADTTFAESVYRAHSDQFRLVAPIDPLATNVTERVGEWAEISGAAGIRLLFLPDGISDAGDAGVAAAINGAAAHGLPVNVQCWRQIGLADELAKRYPNAQLVIDHLGLTQPLTPPAPPNAFDDLAAVVALAGYPNVAIKITGACTYSRQTYPYADLWEPVGRVIDAFGVDRCMWGTDWTRTSSILTYEQGVNAFRDHWPLSQPEKTALMGETAARIYKWTK